MTTAKKEKPIVTVTEREGVTRLEITSPAEVEEIIVNGVLIWAKWEREEYRYIPPAMRPLVQKHQNYLETGEIDRAKTIIADLSIDGENFSCYFACSGRRPIHARFDLILDPHSKHFREELDSKECEPFLNVVCSEWDRMVTAIRTTGYGFEFSHGGNDIYDAWWDVVIPTTGYEEAKFLACVQAINTFSEALASLEKKFGIR